MTRRKYAEAFELMRVRREIDGPGRWGEVRKEVPQVPERTFWRYVGLLNARSEEASEQPAAEEVSEAESDDYERGPDQLKEEFDVSAAGWFADMRNLHDVMYEYYLASVNAETGEITNPAMCQRYLSMRTKVLDLEARWAVKMNGLKNFQLFTKLVNWAISLEAPETSVRLADRVNKNRQRMANGQAPLP